MYTLDTNAIIYYLDRDPAVVTLLDRLFDNVDATFYVPTVTELELYSWTLAWPVMLGTCAGYTA